MYVEAQLSRWQKPLRESIQASPILVLIQSPEKFVRNLQWRVTSYAVRDVRWREDRGCRLITVGFQNPTIFWGPAMSIASQLPRFQGWNLGNFMQVQRQSKGDPSASCKSSPQPCGHEAHHWNYIGTWNRMEHCQTFTPLYAHLYVLSWHRGLSFFHIAVSWWGY